MVTQPTICARAVDALGRHKQGAAVPRCVVSSCGAAGPTTRTMVGRPWWRALLGRAASCVGRQRRAWWPCPPQHSPPQSRGVRSGTPHECVCAHTGLLVAGAAIRTHRHVGGSHSHHGASHGWLPPIASQTCAPIPRSWAGGRHNTNDTAARATHATPHTRQSWRRAAGGHAARAHTRTLSAVVCVRVSARGGKAQADATGRRTTSEHRISPGEVVRGRSWAASTAACRAL